MSSYKRYGKEVRKKGQWVECKVFKFNNLSTLTKQGALMFKKTAYLVIAFFILGILGVHFAAAKESIVGIGVKGVRGPIDKISLVFEKKNPHIVISTKEKAGGVAIETIGKGVPGYNFGMITRPLNAEEKAAYPDVKAFLFARDGIAIVVHPDNPVKGLTSAQVRDIYSGKVTNWADVGGERGVISVLIREAGSGQRVAFEKAIMGDEEPGPRARVLGSMGGMKGEVEIDRSAIGYILISAVDDDVKSLALDGHAATLENVKAGTYVVNVPFYLITKGDPQGATKTFIDYLMSPEGQVAVKRKDLAPAVR